MSNYSLKPPCVKLQKILQICLRSFVNFHPRLFSNFLRFFIFLNKIKMLMYIIQRWLRFLRPSCYIGSLEVDSFLVSKITSERSANHKLIKIWVVPVWTWIFRWMVSSKDLSYKLFLLISKRLHKLMKLIKWLIMIIIVSFVYR